MIFENDYLAFDLGDLDAVERRFDFTFAFDKPAQGLIYFHQMHRADAAVDSHETRDRQQLFNRSRMKGDYRADVVQTQIVAQFVVGDRADVTLK